MISKTSLMMTAVLLTAFIPAPVVYAMTPSTGSFSETVVPQTNYGLHVPWATPRLRIMKDGSTILFAGEWPNFPVKNLRLWDTKTTWADLQPKAGPNGYSWRTLDAQIANAHMHGTNDITLVLAGTPEWAATKPTPNSAAWLGKNSASPPSPAAWKRYVTALVTRYKGKITAYEIWNEPNSEQFWQGTPRQLADLTHTAYSIIKRIDPTALVLAPAPCIINETNLPSANAIWRALAQQNWPADIATVHIYPPAGEGLDMFNVLAKNAKKTLTRNGWTGRLWLTEVSYQSSNTAAPSGTPLTYDEAYRLVTATTKDSLKYADRIYWYAWTGEDYGVPHISLLFQKGTGAADALKHYRTPYTVVQGKR